MILIFWLIDIGTDKDIGCLSLMYQKEKKTETLWMFVMSVNSWLSSQLI